MQNYSVRPEALKKFTTAIFEAAGLKTTKQLPLQNFWFMQISEMFTAMAFFARFLIWKKSREVVLLKQVLIQL